MGIHLATTRWVSEWTSNLILIARERHGLCNFLSFFFLWRKSLRKEKSKSGRSFSLKQTFRRLRGSSECLAILIPKLQLIAYFEAELQETLEAGICITLHPNSRPGDQPSPTPISILENHSRMYFNKTLFNGPSPPAS